LYFFGFSEVYGRARLQLIIEVSAGIFVEENAGLFPEQVSVSRSHFIPGTENL
jgi:hypothetical protein